MCGCRTMFLFQKPKLNYFWATKQRESSCAAVCGGAAPPSIFSLYIIPADKDWEASHHRQVQGLSLNSFLNKLFSLSKCSCVICARLACQFHWSGMFYIQSVGKIEVEDTLALWLFLNKKWQMCPRVHFASMRTIQLSVKTVILGIYHRKLDPYLIMT